jgi:hypothetical protein
LAGIIFITFSFCFLIRYCTFGIAPERANIDDFEVKAVGREVRDHCRQPRQRHCEPGAAPRFRRNAILGIAGLSRQEQAQRSLVDPGQSQQRQLAIGHSPQPGERADQIRPPALRHVDRCARQQALVIGIFCIDQRRDELEARSGDREPRV